MDYDLHIHTQYCGHAPTMTVPDIIHRAEELRLSTIAITDHIYDQSGIETIEMIKADAAAVKHNLNLIIGAEVDVCGLNTDGRLAAEDLSTIDYIIAGIHYVPGEGNYPRSPSDCSLSQIELFRRWRSTILGVVGNSKVCVLAHPLRMIATSLKYSHIAFADILETLDKATRISAENNTAWEINELSSSKIPPEYFDRWHEVFEIALRNNVKLIYGSDSHKPDEIAQSRYSEMTLSTLPEGALQDADYMGRFIT